MRKWITYYFQTLVTYDKNTFLIASYIPVNWSFLIIDIYANK